MQVVPLREISNYWLFIEFWIYRKKVFILFLSSIKLQRIKVLIPASIEFFTNSETRWPSVPWPSKIPRIL